MTPPKITRRGLIKALAGLTPTVLIGQATPPAVSPPAPALRKVFLAEAFIAGFRAAAEQRVCWYSQYAEEMDCGLRLTPPKGERGVCPCCGYPTLESGLCPLCWWTDDDEAGIFGPDHINHGANAGYSLTEARANFHERLTMFRPDDPRGRFDASPDVLAAKRGMIAAFDRMRELDDDATVRGLWYAVYHCEDRLAGLLETWGPSS